MKPPPIQRSRGRAGAATASAAPATLQQGFLVADKYGLIEPIGTGSMGSVWKATHVMLGHTVAIKFLHASIEAYPEGRARFEREAKLSARLGEASRHICRVSDFGVMGSGTPFVVMEYLQGDELSARLKREQQLPLSLVVDVVVQLCRALAVAHDAGVVHRDLKPANVFLCKPQEGEGVFVKLLDFGVAKAALEHEDTQATRAGMVFGTPGYMSPEQILADGELDARADLWSVAVLVYRMAVGRTPFGGGSMSELGLRILTMTPATPSTTRPDLPAGFDAWMKKGLAKRREERFASATELADALVAVANGAVPVLVERVEPERSTLTPGDEATYNPLYRSEAAPDPAPVRRRQTWLAVAAGALLVCLVVGLVILSGRGSGAAPAASAEAEPRPSSAARAEASIAHAADTAKPVPAAPPPPAASAVPVASADTLPDAVAVPATSALPSSVSRPARKFTPKAPREVRRVETVQKRANDLWNKKDEL